MLKNIALSDLVSPKIDARTVDDEERLIGLIESVKRYGLIEPIVVKDIGEGKYEVIAGSRRVMAAKNAGMGKIPAIVHRGNYEDAEAIRLEENINREDLSHVDIARYIEKLMQYYHINQTEVARRIGKTPAYVAQMLNLLYKDPVIRDMVEKEEISYAVGRELLRIPRDEERQRFARYAKESGANLPTVRRWTARELSDMNRKAGEFHKPEPEPVAVEPDKYIVTHPCRACGRVGPLDAMVIIRTCPDCGAAIENAIEQGVFHVTDTERENSSEPGDRGNTDDNTEASDIGETGSDA